MTTDKPYGLWDSPLTPKSMAGDLGIKEVGWAGDGETVVWLESRGKQGVLVARRANDAQWDLTREDDVGGGVGYGGGGFAVAGDTVFFARDDGRLCRIGLDEGATRPLTPEHGRVASPTVSPDGDWVAYVHTDGSTDVVAVVDADGEQWPAKLVQGADFYMQPAWHPEGNQLAWVEWDHPNMPWDGTRLCTAEVQVVEGNLVVGEPRQWAGGSEASVTQPEFSPDGRHLAYISDEDGWWHLYVRNLETGEVRQLTEGEFEMGGPAWVQGLRYYSWTPDGESLAARKNERGQMSMKRIGLDGEISTLEAIDEYDSLAQPTLSNTGRLAFLGSSSTQPTRVVTWAPGEEERVERRSSAERVPESELATMEPVSWKVLEGDREVEVYGNYYPPTNPNFESGGKPPAILMVHGGPTSQRTAAFEARSQFFATRGFAVVDVNYRGSTGYGRSYRDALLGEWGEMDLKDVLGAKSWLAREGLADPNRCVVMGGSAGGYTVLQMLVRHPGEFAGGIAMYGISNLFELAMDTHKFEAKYTDKLVGPLPEASELYRERSPLYHAENIKDPVAVFQGADDKVVPKPQSDSIVETLKARGVPHVYHVYDGEGHGWRKPETIEHFYGACVDFLREHVLFK